MQFTTNLNMALAANIPLISTVSICSNSAQWTLPDNLLVQDWANGVACGQKNPAVNMDIMGFCNREVGSNNHASANNLTVGHPWARNGVQHDGWKVSITGPICPGNSKLVPSNYCNAQMHFLCANVGGPKGAGTGYFGAGGCHESKIERV
ncbi:hypothetical protein LTR48_006466 [Friedmanniomyces endolithicus]|uniref:Uncharacterized protein n=1 Tax=Rachicladosporium monterosium TaxID=1507873 RepID=A0ABR0KZ06_9PEZI|nr:hypothetical protein LTR48_006466 [Friedmanniomyces endolithicus]KAK5140886.1 hypothetical protein LTR32_006431 [Rachicladosporium monterosium]